MFERSISAGLFACLLAVVPAVAADKPYHVSLTGDAYTGDGWMTGVRIELDDGWKTYWRMPGEAGIPPEFTWTSSVPAQIDVRYPLPGRYEDASGETVGYKHEVILPVLVKAGDATSLTLDLDLFFAVCKDICIPASAKASKVFGPAARDPDGSREVERWMQQVPLPGEIVTDASVAVEAGKPVLHLSLAEPAEDIFIETDTAAYFRRPQMVSDGMRASLVIDNVKDPRELEGAHLRITLSQFGQGLEQDVTLP